MYVSLALLWTSGFTAAVCSVGLIIAAIVLFRRKKLRPAPFLCGLAVCLAAELLLSRFLIAWVTSREGYAEAFDTTGRVLLLYSLPSAFFAELFRFIAVRILLKKPQSKTAVASFGIGSGLCGAFVTTGVFVLTNFVLMLMLRTGSFFDIVYPHIGDSEMSVIRAQISSFTSTSFIWLIPVAAARCAMHIICTELMRIGISRDRLGECLAALLFHAAFNALAYSISRNWFEALLLCVLCVGAGVYIRKKPEATVYERNT